MSENKVEPLHYYSNYHGHEVEYLEKVLKTLRKENDSIIFLAGDSSLDNKHWLYENNSKTSPSSYLKAEITDVALQGYEKILDPPRMIKDVAFWMNLEANQQGKRIATINCAVEEATLGEHADGNLFPQDKFLRDNITENDILIVSIGGNDIALKATPCTAAHIAIGVWCIPQCCVEYCGCSCVPDCGECIPGWCCNFCAWPCTAGYFVDLFGNKVQRYIKNLTSKKVPKKIIPCMIYYIDETEGNTWTDEFLKYVAYDTNPGKLQSVTRLIYRIGTKSIRRKGSEVIPFPLYEVLDSKDTRDYDNRVEPSILGGEKMGRALFKTAVGGKNIYS